MHLTATMYALRGAKIGYRFTMITMYKTENAGKCPRCGQNSWILLLKKSKDEKSKYTCRFCGEITEEKIEILDDLK